MYSIPDSIITTQVPHSPSRHPNGSALPEASTMSWIVLPGMTLIAKKSFIISTRVVLPTPLLIAIIYPLGHPFDTVCKNLRKVLFIPPLLEIAPPSGRLVRHGVL